MTSATVPVSQVPVGGGVILGDLGGVVVVQPTPGCLQGVQRDLPAPGLRRRLVRRAATITCPCHGSIFSDRRRRRVHPGPGARRRSAVDCPRGVPGAQHTSRRPERRLTRGRSVDLPPGPGSIPDEPGVYRFRDAHGRVIYVGKAKSLRQRLNSYFADLAALHPRTAADGDAPRRRSTGRSSPPRSRRSSSSTPGSRSSTRASTSSTATTSATRGSRSRSTRSSRGVQVMRGAKRKGVRYFGPYAHAWAIRETARPAAAGLPGAHLLATASSSGPGRSAARACSATSASARAPCVGRVSAEEHRADRRRLLRLHGRPDRRRSSGGSRREMRAAADELEYERAARLRDDLGALRAGAGEAGGRARRRHRRRRRRASPRTSSRPPSRSSTSAAAGPRPARLGRRQGRGADDRRSSSSSSCCSSTAAPRTATPTSRARCWSRRCPHDADDASPSWLARAARAAGSSSGCRSAATSGPCMETVAAQRRAGPDPAQDSGAAGDLTARSQALERAAGGARPGRGAAADRVLRRLQPPGHRRRRVDGRLRGRPGPQVASTAGSPSRTAPTGSDDVAAIARGRHAAGSRATSTSRRRCRPRSRRTPSRRSPASTRRPAGRASSPTRRNLVVVDGGAAAGRGRPGARWTSSASTTSRSCGLAKRLEEVWLPGEPRPGDPAAHQRGAVPAAAGPRRGAPVRDHLPPAEALQVDDRRRVLDGVPGLGETRRKALLAHFGSLKRLRAADGRGDRRGARHRAAHRRGASWPRCADGEPRRHPAVNVDDRRDPGRDATDAPDGSRRDRRAAERRPAASRRSWSIVTGMSGAGRSTAAKCLEDLGWFVVDNLPPALLPTLVELGDRSQGAVHPDRRRGGRARPGVLRRPARRARRSWTSAGRDPRVLFLEAADDVLVRRFESVAAPAPAAGRRPARRRHRGASASCCADLRDEADLVIDTSDLNVHQLRAQIDAGVRAATGATRPARTVMSFGFKYGLPVDADLVVDVPLPAQPALGPGAAAAHRPGPRGARLRARPAGRRRASSTATRELLRDRRAPATCARASAT